MRSIVTLHITGKRATGLHCPRTAGSRGWNQRKSGCGGADAEGARRADPVRPSPCQSYLGREWHQNVTRFHGPVERSVRGRIWPTLGADLADEDRATKQRLLGKLADSTLRVLLGSKFDDSAGHRELFSSGTRLCELRTRIPSRYLSV